MDIKISNKIKISAEIQREYLIEISTRKKGWYSSTATWWFGHTNSGTMPFLHTTTGS
jgi:hypothetical protein